MNRLKISARMVMLIGALSMLLLAIGGIGLLCIGQSNAALLSVYEQRTVPMGQVAEIQARLLALIVCALVLFEGGVVPDDGRLELLDGLPADLPERVSAHQTGALHDGTVADETNAGLMQPAERIHRDAV